MTQGPCVLIIDDDASIRELVRFVLTEEGFDVVEAPDGATALELIEHLQPALVLLDLLMPVMDGWQFMEMYRHSKRATAPIIALSALAPSDVRGALPSEVAELLPKPFDLVDLVAAVQRHASAGSDDRQSGGRTGCGVLTPV